MIVFIILFNFSIITILVYRLRKEGLRGMIAEARFIPSINMGQGSGGGIETPGCVFFPVSIIFIIAYIYGNFYFFLAAISALFY